VKPEPTPPATTATPAPTPPPAPGRTTVAATFFQPAVDTQLRNNRETGAHGELYAPHRHHLREIILNASPTPGGRLCVLGAGNAHSLDLTALTRHFDEVCLVDLDRDALEAAAARTPEATREKLVLRAPIDASGLGAQLDAWSAGQSPSPAELAALPAEVAAALSAVLPGRFDLVVSDCLLTQIHWACHQALGKAGEVDPVASDRIVRCALRSHLHALAALTRPGGAALLVTDAISSDDLPLWKVFAATDPTWLLGELDRAGKLFSGTSPALVSHLLQDDPALATTVAKHEVGSPWLWQQARHRILLVYATTLWRRPEV
jgi:hypothetical protein